MKPLDELMADWRRNLDWMEAQVRESSKRIVPLTPEQQLEHEQMVRVLLDERKRLRAAEARQSPTATEALMSAARDRLRERLERAGVETAFDMIWRSR